MQYGEVVSLGRAFVDFADVAAAAAGATEEEGAEEEAEEEGEEAGEALPTSVHSSHCRMHTSARGE